RRKDLLELCEVPNGSGSKLIYRLLEADLIRVVELPKGDKYRGRGPYLIIPTDKLLNMTIDEAMGKVVKKPGRPPGRRSAASTSTKTPTKSLQKVVVTRHNALVDYMREIGLIDETTPVYPHVRGPMIEGRH